MPLSKETKPNQTKMIIKNTSISNLNLQNSRKKRGIIVLMKVFKMK